MAAEIILKPEDVWDFAVDHKYKLMDYKSFVIAKGIDGDGDPIWVLLEGFSDEEVERDDRIISNDGFGVYVEDLETEIDWVFVRNSKQCEEVVKYFYEKYLLL